MMTEIPIDGFFDPESETTESAKLTDARSCEYRLCSSRRSAENSRELISSGGLSTGSPLRIQMDGEHGFVKLYSEDGRILGHLSPPDAIKVLDKYVDGTAFCAAAGKVDLTACIIKTVKITGLK